ncbi:MAG: hypothetical protein CVU65_12730 [Deltaproteobacteria bacterium HGW-Deltaproteobacteria-22]|jgi:hypothetical protein|nr:MAG: hypothetical protein CVU65_12730 [Deltaproteobacteria bacterium HGW-Deltaproteobacteria-22]
MQHFFGNHCAILYLFIVLGACANGGNSPGRSTGPDASTMAPETAMKAEPPALVAAVPADAPALCPPSKNGFDLKRETVSLADAGQAVRDCAAAAIRAYLAKHPQAGDVGEDHWKAKLKSIKPGITQKAFEVATGGKNEGGVGSGRSFSITWRLDDYWVVTTHFDLPDSLRTVDEPMRHARGVWVDPGKNYSGKWITYFVNGLMSHEIRYKNGVYESFRTYYDNGQLVSEQTYVNGRIHGPELGFHRNGARSYSIAYDDGKSTGRWAHWYPDGKLQSEHTYKDGKPHGSNVNYRPDGTKSSRIDYRDGVETGQAAWDEQGKLLYARGTAAAAAGTP